MRASSVPGAGIEPARPVPDTDFKSRASANSGIGIKQINQLILKLSEKYKKKKALISESFFCTRSRHRTGTSITGHGILSPARLPIPPSGQQLDFQ